MDEFRIDFRYIDIDYELWAVANMIRLVEPSIELLRAQDKQETLEDPRVLDPGAADDIAMDLQEMSERHDYVLPRFMRGPLLVSLWACFESGVKNVAMVRQQEARAPLALSDIRGDSFLRRSTKYFDAVLGLPVDLDPDRLDRLADLYRVRCAIAHANAQRDLMTPDEWRELARIARRRGFPLDESRGFLVLTSDYLQEANADVSGCLLDLVKRARSTTANPGPSAAPA